MKKSLLAIVAIITVLNACKKVNTVSEQENIKNPAVLSSATINSFIKAQIEASGKFEWSTASDEMIWSALQQSDNILSVGYKPSNETSVDDRLADINIQAPRWKTAKNEVINIILTAEGKTRTGINAGNIEEWEETILPVIDVRVENFETVRLLRASNLVRYAEPMGYEPYRINENNGTQSSSGCGSNVADAVLTDGVDYTTIAPNTKQSWNYPYHNIPQAWTKSTGAGVKVFIIDSGCEFDQDNLGSAFNQGSSSGRSVEKIVTLPRSTFLGIPPAR